MWEAQMELDKRIRDWVLFPIAIATFCMGIVLQSVGMLLRRLPTVRQHKIKESSSLFRLGLFKLNYSALPPDQFLARRNFFMDEKTGFLNVKRQEKGFMNMVMNPDFMVTKLTELMTSIVPQMIFGAWIRYVFGGFAVCRVPFPLPMRFKTMLQSGIEVTSRDLDVSYVSALSWYVLNLFGNQGVYRVALASPNVGPIELPPNSSAALSMMINDQMEMNWSSFCATEKVNVSRIRYQWDLLGAEEELLKVDFDQIK